MVNHTKHLQKTNFAEVNRHFSQDVKRVVLKKIIEKISNPMNIESMAFFVDCYEK